MHSYFIDIQKDLKKNRLHAKVDQHSPNELRNYIIFLFLSIIYFYIHNAMFYPPIIYIILHLVSSVNMPEQECIPKNPFSAHKMAATTKMATKIAGNRKCQGVTAAAKHVMWCTSSAATSTSCKKGVTDRPQRVRDCQKLKYWSIFKAENQPTLCKRKLQQEIVQLLHTVRFNLNVSQKCSLFSYWYWCWMNWWIGEQCEDISLKSCMKNNLLNKGWIDEPSMHLSDSKEVPLPETLGLSI